MIFTKRQSFGPKISLTDRQIAKLIQRLNDAGLTCDVENCWTGSCYVSISEAELDDDGQPDFDSPGNHVATIRLSGHPQGRRTYGITHNAIWPTKTQCIASLNKWVDEIISHHTR